MRYAIYIPPNTKDLTTNLTMVAYGNRQNATTFARANISDLSRSLKHLMETRLYCCFTTALLVYLIHIMTSHSFVWNVLFIDSQHNRQARYSKSLMYIFSQNGYIQLSCFAVYIMEEVYCMKCVLLECYRKVVTFQSVAI